MLVVGTAQTPDWDDWPIYAAAIAAQVVRHAPSPRRACLELPRRSPREIFGEMRMANRVDLLLAPVGLLAAFGAAEQPYAVLLVVPLAGSSS